MGPVGGWEGSGRVTPSPQSRKRICKYSIARARVALDWDWAGNMPIHPSIAFERFESS